MTQADVFARIGAFSFHRRRWVIGAWLLLLVCGGVGGTSVFSRLSDQSSASTSESSRGFGLLHTVALGGDSVVAVVDRAPVRDPGTRSEITTAAADIRGMPHVAQVHDAYDDPRLRTPDGSSSLVVVHLADNLTDSFEEQLANAIRDRLKAMPAGKVSVGGEALLWPEFRHSAQTDAERGEAVAFPIALIALIFVFGGLAAASVPLLTSIVAVAGSLVLVLAASLFTDVASYSVNIVTMLGLGLAIDYGLLTVNRFREERARGESLGEAVETTTATAGRTVAFSAMTVVASFAGLLVFNDPIFRSLAVGGIGVVIVAALAALTLTPALLGVLGGRIRPTRSTDQGGFSRLARWVHRRPVPIVVVIGIALLAAGAPFLHAHYRSGGADALSSGAEVRKVADDLAARFPAQQIQPVLVVATTPAQNPALTAYTTQLRQRPDVSSMSEISAPTTSPPVTMLRIVPVGDSQGPQAQHLVNDLRAHRPGFPTLVTGQAAYLLDFKHAIVHGLPWALLLVCIATVLLLFLMTGSVLVPIKALVMNFLSLGATFGVLVWVFQDGHFAGLVGASRSGALETVVPVLVFVFAFGLSMDYEVFLVSRIRELVEAGMSNDQAVERALQRTGRIITSAALLIVIVFIGFATASSLIVKEMGIALATAVIVDVTLVRCLLVPATMTLLGDRNWWAPRPLRRLHARFGIREHVPVEAPAAVVD